MSNETEITGSPADTQAPRRRNGDRRIMSFEETKVAFAELGIEERRVSGDRRRNPFQLWRRIVLGGLPVVVVDRQEAARVIVEEALKRQNQWRYPAYLTSTNGEVTYRCDVDQTERSLFLQADAISADGMFHVFVSRFKGDALPERVATSDLFYDVAERAQAQGATMYMLGATKDANQAAVDAVKAEFPQLRLVGHRHGYFDGPADEIAVCDEIASLAPDILWVSMGVPREQEFVVRNRARLSSIGVIKTSGGLFDFLSGNAVRAPLWMQNVGLEWLWRVCREPRRLAWRYIKTNPRALYLLLTNSR
jgi:N-acetylglucosaminyldiphosphoundecaprenol N-acetyl-beta-D-mannosaminyltransferase